MPADIKTLALLPKRVVAGSGTSDFFSALTVAADLMKRTAEDRKLTSARKCIVIASPFSAVIEPVEDALLVRCTPTCRVGQFRPLTASRRVCTPSTRRRRLVSQFGGSQRRWRPAACVPDGIAVGQRLFRGE